jgi:hypothetical protein
VASSAEIDRVGGMEFVDLQVAADLSVPTEPFLENPEPKPMHRGEFVEELARSFGAEELDQCSPPAALPTARVTKGVPISVLDSNSR